jgi:hypothetical protein
VESGGFEASAEASHIVQFNLDFGLDSHHKE